MISKIKSLSFCLPIIIFIASIFTACTMLEENPGTGSVSFRIDNSAVQKIADAADQENRNARTADEPRSLFMDVTISGGYSESKTVPLETEGTASFEGVPVGANITVSATAYYKEADTRQDLYQGQSKPFTVRNGENQVVFVLKRIAGDDDDSGSGSGSGSATANVLPENKIYVANTADGGASTNDGTEEHPLDTIENAVAKIHELIEDPNNSYNSGEEWGIVVMSDLQGGQILSDDADSDVTGFVLASKEATDVKTLNGGFDNTNPGTTLKITSVKAVVLQYIKITGGYSNDVYYGGGGVHYRGEKLSVKSGAEIYGNKTVGRGGGILAAVDSTNLTVEIDGGSIYQNECNTSSGMGGGIFVGGMQEGYGSGNATLIIKNGSIQGNKCDNGGGISVTGKTEIEMTGGSITENTNYTANSGAGGGIYLDISGNSYAINFIMTSGSISSNSAKDGAGVWFNKGNASWHGGLFKIGGTAQFGTNDNVYLHNTFIGLYDDLENADLPKIEPHSTSYATTTKIVDNTINLGLADFAETCAQFSVKPQNGTTPWYVGYNGNLTTTNSSIESNIPIYVSDTGTTDGDGSSAHPFATLENAVDYIRNNPYSKANFVVNISGTINGETYIGENIVAKSIRLVGANGVDGSGVPQDVLDGDGDDNGVLTVAAQNLKVYIKDLKITHNERGLMVGGYDQNGNSVSSEVILDGGVYITNNQGPGGSGAGIYIGEYSSVTMKSGCEISNNIAGNGLCGGVYISSDGTFLMQGGTISNSQAKEGNAAVYVRGRFEMSGDASIPYDATNNRNYVVIPMAETEIGSGVYEAPYPLTIAGNLTAATALSIKLESVYGYDPNFVYTNGWEIVSETTAGLLTSNHSKIAIIPEYGSSTTWTINEDGQLDDGSGNGGGGTNGNVVNLYVNSLSGYGSDSNNGLSEDSALMTLGAAFDKMTDSTKDYVVNVMSKIWQTDLTSDYSQLEISSSVAANSIKIKGTNTDSDEREINGQFGPEAGRVIKVSTSVPVTFENITITGGVAGTSDTYYGGCIYISSASTVILGQGTVVQGGKVSGGLGGGVYVANGGTLVMKDDAVVHVDLENNSSDVYLAGNAKITIGSTLTGQTSATIPYVAQITPEDYPITPLIAVAGDSGTNLTNEHNKFAVTTLTNEFGTFNFVLDVNGCLEQVRLWTATPDSTTIASGANIVIRITNSETSDHTTIDTSKFVLKKHNGETFVNYTGTVTYTPSITEIVLTATTDQAGTGSRSFKLYYDSEEIGEWTFDIQE